MTFASAAKARTSRPVLQDVARDHFRETTLRRDRYFNEIIRASGATPFHRQLDVRIGGIHRPDENLIPFIRCDAAQRTV